MLYARDPRRPRGYYAASLLLLLLSSLSKAQAVVLPLTFFLVDFWFSRRDLRRLILEKLPFFALSLLVGYWATIAQASSITAARLAQYSVPERALIAGYNLVAYLLKLVAPYSLAAFYGYPAGLRAIGWSLPVLAGLAVLFYLYGRRSKPALFGVLFFTLAISPVIQLLPIGDAIIADRFTYVPYVGLFLWAGHLVERGVAKARPHRLLVGTLVGAQLAVFAAKSHVQARTWRDTEALWQQVLRVDPDEPRAHNNLGVILLGRDRVGEAIAHLERCVANGARYDRINETYSNLGSAYSRIGQDERALAMYDLAIQKGPGFAEAWLNRGLVQAKLNRYERAIADYTKAIELAPGNPQGFYSRGNAQRRLGRMEAAIADYSRAIEIDGAFAGAYANRGNSYADLGEPRRAIEDYDAAVRLRPEEGLNYLNRSKAYFNLGEFGKALEDCEQASRRGSMYPGYLDELRRRAGTGG